MLSNPMDLFEMTPLHEAASENDVEQVRRLLDEGVDVNARAFFGTTPLMDACTINKTEMRQAMKQMREVASEEKPRDAAEMLKNMPRLDFKQAFAEMNKKREYDDSLPEDDSTVPRLLLDRGAEVNAVDQQGHSALIKAAIAGRIETMRVLLEHGADFRSADKEDLTPLMLAAQSRRLEAVELLLEWGADADARTPRGGTTLMLAAEGGRVDVAKLLLTRRQDVNTVGVNGQTALLSAALKEHDDMIAFLKAKGANIGFLESVALGDLEAAQNLPVPDIAYRGPQWGWQVLFRAAKQGLPDAIRLLTGRGISANASGASGQPVLLSAVMRGGIECVHALLDAGADPNGGTGSHFSPLKWAAQNNDTEIMELLLARGAGPNKADAPDDSALTGAVMFGNHQTARRLLEAGADPNAKALGALSLLQMAVTKDDKEMVRLLLDHGAQSKGQDASMLSVMAQDKPEIAAMLKEAAGTHLHELAKEGKTAELLAHLDAGVDINARGEYEETLLIAALRGKQSDTARVLIERGIDVNVLDKIGQTALICATMRGDMETTRLLLAKSADTNIVDGNGHTPLFWAALGDKKEIVTLLLDAGTRVGPVEAAVLGDLSAVRNLLNAGADVDTRAPSGMTPLMGAAAGGHTDIITTLLIRGADINAVDQQGKTALAWAAEHKRIEAIRLLLAQGTDVNLSGEDIVFTRRIHQSMQKPHLADSEVMSSFLNRRGPVPLSLVVLHEDTSFAALLLEHGADINSPHGIAHHTPLASAAMMGRVDTVRFLLEHGADPNIKDEMGYTALSMAEERGKNPEVVTILKAHLAAKGRATGTDV